MTSDRVATSFSTLTGQAVTHVSRLSGGSSLPSWRVDTREHSYAVRLHTDPHPAHGQAPLFKYLTSQNFPIPKVIAVGEHECHHALVLSWIPGTTFADVLRAAPERVSELGLLFGKMRARLHALDLPSEVCERLPIVKDARAGSGRATLLHLDYPT